MSKAPPFTCYLIFDRYGITGFRKCRPDLRAGEHAVKIRLRIPPETFANDLPEAIIDVPAPAVIHPEVTIEEP